MPSTSGGQRISFLEFLYGKPGASLAQFAGNPGAFESLIRDVFAQISSEKVELHRQIADLESRNKDLQAYAHMVAHELKDPLTVMVVASDVIGRVDNLTTTEMGELLQEIRSTAYEMNTIVDSLLLLAEVRALEGPSEVVNMDRVVSNALRHLTPVIKERGARIDVPKSWPAAMGHEPWVEEVWANYLANGLKHGGNPPAMALGSSPEQDGMIRFWTRDNGPGLAPEAQARLFAPFYPVRKARNGGHGVGLSIVRQIVEKLGGTVGVESEIGRGSLFYFTLPAAA